MPGDVLSPGVFRQSRHGQDHCGADRGQGLQSPGDPEQGAPGGGGPQRPGGRLCGPDRPENPGGDQPGPGRRAVYRRGVHPHAGERGQGFWSGGHRHGPEGHGGPP